MEKLVTIRTYDDYFSANAMLEVLIESGIQAILLNENSGTMLPSLATGGIKMQVIKEDEARAKEIIDSIEKENKASQDSDAF